MKNGIGMWVLYAAIIGVGIWIWRLVTDNGMMTGNGTNGTNGSTVTLTPSTSPGTGEAATTFGALVDWVQDVSGADGWGSAVVDAIQSKLGHG